MTQQTAELVEAWIGKATNDLVSARQILILADAPTDTVCFHVQQAVEKALKGLLTFHGVPFPKTHSLLRLLEFTLPFLPRLDGFRIQLAELSAYGVEFRYPGGLPDPPREQAEEAIQVAEDVMEMVCSHIRKPA